MAEEKPAIGQSAAAKPTDEQYRFARLVTAFELTNTHFAAERILPASPEGVEKLRENATKVSRYLADQMLTEVKVGAEWEVSIIRPADQNRKSLTEFEKQAVEKIRQGAEEVGERTPSGTVCYVRSFRMQEKCAECHQPPAKTEGLPPGVLAMKVGDVIATYSLEIAFKDLPVTEPAGRAVDKK